MPRVTLQVLYETQDPDDVVCVTGNILELGSWSPSELQLLNKADSEEHEESNKSRWTYTFDCKDSTEIRYRYAVCSLSKHQGSKIIVYWETEYEPRKINIKDEAHRTELQTFGKYGGKVSIQRGWLVGTREIRLWFEKAPLQCFAGARTHPCRVRIAATAVAESSSTDSVPLPIHVHNYSRQDFTPRPQAEEGEAINAMSDIVTFSARNLPAARDVRLVIQLLRAGNTPCEVSPAKRSKVNGDVVGSACIMGSMLTGSVGSIPLHFFDDAGHSMGKVPVSYTVIEPLDDPLAHSLEVSYATHWNRPGGRTLNVGHRGMGKSHRDPSLRKDIDEDSKLVSVPENTVCSLREAAEHGADYVEFDVHVTKDGCPVLFHDFQFSLCLPKGDSAERTRLAKLSIKDMTLEELSAVSKLVQVGLGSTDFLCSERTSFKEDELPFTKLQMALQTVPLQCGFDIEVKYPMICENSGSEFDGIPADMNASVNAILRVVLKYGGARRIFFSAFHPDVCAMIRLKQSKYPVMLCNYGRTDLYESYADPRSITVERGMLTALAEQILGLCGNCEDYLASPGLVDQCHSNGLVLACWGERTVEPVVREQLTSMGVDAIIHDRMGSFPRGMKNNFMTAEEM